MTKIIHGNSREFTGDFLDKRTGGDFMNWRTREKIHENSREFTGDFLDKRTGGVFMNWRTRETIHGNSREIFRQKDSRNKIDVDRRK